LERGWLGEPGVRRVKDNEYENENENGNEKVADNS
jgi:hypothetical protein